MPPIDISASLILSGQTVSAQDAQSPAVPGPLRRAAIVIGDLGLAVGIGLCIPFVILAIGMPVALSVRFLLWIVGML
jgi:hypothetical protein